MGKDAVYFVSDAHLGEGLPYDPARQDRLIRLLGGLRTKAGRVFILGDLFDFWIEYRHVIRADYFLILHCLRSLIDAGVRIDYLAGNHDFALGAFLTDVVGVTVHPAGLTCELQGKKVFLHHGDGLLKADRRYRMLKKILRNPTHQRLYQMLHPGLGIGLAQFCSHLSRRSHKPDQLKSRAVAYRDIARSIIKKGHDLVFFGHTHWPELVQFPDGMYCNTGDWLGNDTYASLVDGKVALWRYRENAADQPVAPVRLESIKSLMG